MSLYSYSYSCLYSLIISIWYQRGLCWCMIERHSIFIFQIWTFQQYGLDAANISGDTELRRLLKGFERSRVPPSYSLQVSNPWETTEFFPNRKSMCYGAKFFRKKWRSKQTAPRSLPFLLAFLLQFLRTLRPINKKFNFRIYFLNWRTSSHNKSFLSKF